MTSGIDDQKRTREALRQSEEMYRAFFESSAVGMAYVGLDGRLLRVNDKYCEITGYSRAELRDLTVFDLTHPEDREKDREAFRSYAHGEQPLYISKEKRYLRKDGAVRWIAITARIVYDAQGRPQHSIGIVQDITEHKLAEEALHRSEARLTQAVNLAGLATFEHDHRTDLIEYSPLMRELMGFGSEQPITLEAIAQRVLPEDRPAAAAAVERAHDPAGNGLFEVEVRVRGRDGRVRWVSARSQTFFEGEGSGRRPVRTIGAALDVTERKETQAGLERLVAERTAELQELVGELEHFSYTITHDMRAPLRGMQGFAQMMSKGCARCQEPLAKGFLQRIITATQRMDSLITDALNYSKAMRQELPLRPVDLGALLEEMRESYPELQAFRERIEVEPGLPTVMGNEAALTQCFSNLLGNALKFVQPGKPPEIRVRAERREGWVRVWVEDKGIGICPTMLSRVFDMFARGSNDYEGNGIGLALVRKVVQRMAGQVGVESDPGQGTRFWFELRAGEVERPGAGSPPPEPAALPTPSVITPPPAATVLYVEDEPNDALFMQLAFTDQGWSSGFQTVADGKAAIEYLSGSGCYAQRERYPVPAAVLLDLNLPKLSGFEVLQWIRAHPAYKDLPVLVFSSSSRQEDQVRAKALGANDFWQKPSSPLLFSSIVQKLPR